MMTIDSLIAHVRDIRSPYGQKWSDQELDSLKIIMNKVGLTDVSDAIASAQSDSTYDEGYNAGYNSALFGRVR